MTADSVSVTDEVIREIGEQVSRTLSGRLSEKTKGLDLFSGIRMYENHFVTYSNLEAIRHNKDRSLNRSTDKQLPGKSFEELDAHVRRREGKKVYTTDELARIKKADEDDPVFKENPGLSAFARENHPQTDLVEPGPDGKIVTYQHKNYAKPKDAIESMLKDSDNDRFVVPEDKYDEVVAELETRIAKGGSEAGKLKKIRQGLEKSPIKSSQARSPRETLLTSVVADAGKRVAGNIAVGVASDVAVFAFGGAVSEIRAAYRSPDELTLMERCERLLRAIWDRLRLVFKDRSLREMGSEVVLVIVSALCRPLKLAKDAVKRIVDVLRRLWMDFVSGKLKTLADVVSAGLKAVYAVASVGVAIVLQQTLSPYFEFVPGGELLAEVIAAVVAAVMIVVGNRAIDHIVRSLFAMFQGAEVARLRREQIEAFCAEHIPQLVADREHLESLVETHLADREALFACTFAELTAARDGNDVDGFLNGLQKLNQAYGKTLPWRTHREFDEFMDDDSQSLKL